MPAAKPARPRTSQSAPPEVVDPRWILKAAGAVVALGLFCSYLTICIFFYETQWQYVLHPSRSVPQTPADLQLGFQPVRFGTDVSGEPQLTGWWIPSDAAANPTVLMLHNESGSMSDALPAAQALHGAHLNILLFDYRGYGISGGRHPSESLMTADATAALRFLQNQQHVSPQDTLVYGAGLGASLATTLCAEHPELAGLILQSADGDTESRVEADQRSRIVPVSWLFHENFPLADPLSVLKTPKLLLSLKPGAPPLYAERAAAPKITVELSGTYSPAAITAAVRRFLDTFVTHAPPTLTQPSL